MDLREHVAVITGASAGIGAATARALSAAGAKLVLTGRRQDRLDELTKGLPTQAVTLAADIGAPETAMRLLDLAQDEFGRADILINNAGVLTVAPIDQVDLDEMSDMIRTNFEAVVRASYIFARVFKAQKSGAIINVSSIGASMTPVTMGVYAGLKRALEAFTDCLRIELSGKGVKVGTIAPGTTSTEIFRGLEARGEKGWDSYIPPLLPEDIARAICFMLEQPDHANVARLQLYAAAEKF